VIEGAFFRWPRVISLTKGDGGSRGGGDGGHGRGAWSVILWGRGRGVMGKKNMISEEIQSIGQWWYSRGLKVLGLISSVRSFNRTVNKIKGF